MEKKVLGKIVKKARTKLWLHKTSRWRGVTCSIQGIALSHGHIHLLTALASLQDCSFLRANSYGLFNPAICMIDEPAIRVLISTSYSEEKVNGFAHHTGISLCLAFTRLTEDGFLHHCSKRDLGNQLQHTEVSHLGTKQKYISSWQTIWKKCEKYYPYSSGLGNWMCK